MGDSVDCIPAELVQLHEVHQRRIARRRESLGSYASKSTNILEPLIKRHREAVHQYEDHFDDGLLKYHRDPNQMAIGERDPLEVKRARALKRTVEDAEQAVRQKEQELNEKLKLTEEYRMLSIAQREFDEWQSQVCTFLSCCVADLNWKERRIRRDTRLMELPEGLLVLPSN
jgi:hypothetical protein